MSSRAPRTTARLFMWSAALSLVPVVLLGFVLARSYQSEAQRRGLAEARSKAHLIAQTAIEPALDGATLERALPADVDQRVQHVTRLAIESHQVLRLRLRSLSGDIVFPPIAAYPGPPDHEVLEATHGAVVALLTRENSDSDDHGAVGEQAVEVYLPLQSANGKERFGVLEVYLPYAPIKADIAGGMHQLLRDALIGLGALYVLLLALSWWMSRGLRRQVARSNFLAEHDVLTQLPNRRHFLEEIAKALDRARAIQTSVTVGIIDLDRFKEINESLGHHNGDAILVELARRFEGAGAEQDPRPIFARLGGDEFGVVFPACEHPRARLERLRTIVADEIVVDNIPITVDASIGYAVAPADGETAPDILQCADLALHVAKLHHSGISRYDPAHDTFDPTDLALVTELRRAIAHDELVLHYQPKLLLTDGRFASVEALVRWHHPSRGLLPPDKFLPLAERTDLIEDLTDWVLQHAIAEIGTIGGDFGLAVNVSARSLARRDFTERVLRAIGDAGFDPKRLTIEITETTLMSDPERAAIGLSQLDAFGVRISLDDFGTGQTSLGYLSSLPIDELKVDRSFVGNMVSDRSSAAIVRSIIDLGHNLRLRVVAEGIEQRDVLTALLDVGCDEGQGFLFARPMPAADLNRFLSITPTFTAEDLPWERRS